MQERDILIQNWLDAKERLAQVQELEKTLRAEVLKLCLGENAPEKGTVNYDLGNGYGLKFKLNLSYSIDKAKVEDMLSKLERQGDEGKFIAGRIVNFKPELSLTEYNKLEPKMRKIVDDYVTSKPASPQIEFVQPKA